MPTKITLRRGQVVPFPRSPTGFAQVDELLRCRVVLLYRRRGRLCRRAVHVRRVDVLLRCNQLLPGFPEPDDNPLRRGIVAAGRVKTYEIGEAVH